LFLLLFVLLLLLLLLLALRLLFFGDRLICQDIRWHLVFWRFDLLLFLQFCVLSGRSRLGHRWLTVSHRYFTDGVYNIYIQSFANGYEQRCCKWSNGGEAAESEKVLHVHVLRDVVKGSFISE